jgi:hypothetical protein
MPDEQRLERLRGRQIVQAIRPSEFDLVLFCTLTRVLQIALGELEKALRPRFRFLVMGMTPWQGWRPGGDDGSENAALVEAVAEYGIGSRARCNALQLVGTEIKRTIDVPDLEQVHVARREVEILQCLK